MNRPHEARYFLLRSGLCSVMPAKPIGCVGYVLTTAVSRFKTVDESKSGATWTIYFFHGPYQVIFKTVRFYPSEKRQRLRKDVICHEISELLALLVCPESVLALSTLGDELSVLSDKG